MAGHVGLSVQVQQRLAERLEPGDPHLRRGEGVHPGDHADARSSAVASRHSRLMAVGVGQHRLPRDADQDVRRGVERLRDHAGLAGDLAQRLLAVEVLAAGEEPDLRLGEVLMMRGSPFGVNVSTYGRLPGWP